MTSYTLKDLTPEGVGDLILHELDRLAGKPYAAEQHRNMDLLVYVNKLEHWFENGVMPEPTMFEPYGWRSVSAVVASLHSLVFHARPDAPSFLVGNVGKVRQRWEGVDDE